MIFFTLSRISLLFLFFLTIFNSASALNADDISNITIREVDFNSESDSKKLKNLYIYGLKDLDISVAFKNQFYQKALEWLLYTDSKRPACLLYDFNDISRFYNFNSDFPKKDVAMENIKSCIKNNPQSLHNAIMFFLINENERLLWLMQNSKTDVEEFFKLVKKRGGTEYLLKELFFDDDAIIDDILWNGDVNRALRTLKSVQDRDVKNISMLRMFFQSQGTKFENEIKEISDREFKDYLLRNEGLLFDYITFVRDFAKEPLKAFYALTGTMLKNIKHQKEFYSLEVLLARDLIDAGYIKQAYEVSKIKVYSSYEKKGFYMDEFFAGFVAFKYLKDYKLAQNHFKHLYINANGNAQAVSRSAYFLSRIAKKTGDDETMRFWLKTAAKNISTYYGQLAVLELNSIEPVFMLGFDLYSQKKVKESLLKRAEVYKIYFDYVREEYDGAKSTSEDVYNLLKNESFKIGYALFTSGFVSDSKGFFLDAMGKSGNRYEIKLIIESVKALGAGEEFLSALKTEASNLGVPIISNFKILDFTLKSKNVHYKSLVNAIIKKESAFRVGATSRVGARGYMQLMPGTAKKVARENGFKYNKKKLTSDGRYNITLGNIYIEDLLAKYHGSFPLALASYNGGSLNVDKWLLKQNLNQKNMTYEQMIDFIETIPFKETREYVMKVIETEGFYDYIINAKLYK